MQELLLFYFYRRYRWTAQNFTDLQDNLIGYAKKLSGTIAGTGGGVLFGFQYVFSANPLEVGCSNGVAFGPNGELLVRDSNESLSLTVPDDKWSLIVARAVNTDTNNITKPTDPNLTVPLNKVQSTEIVVKEGSVSAYPSLSGSEVPLFGVRASGGSITLVDLTAQAFLGKNSLFRQMNVVNVKNDYAADFPNLEEALALVSANSKIRVLESQTLENPLTVSEACSIEFGQNVTVNAGTAATGLILAASGVSVQGGRFSGFSGGSDAPIAVTSPYCFVERVRFASNSPNGVVDDLGLSSVSNVIYE